MTDRMQVFIDYATYYRPGFADDIEGATPSEINTLGALVRRPLPTFYRQFLERMGRCDGGLDIGAGASTNVRDVIEYYDEIVRLGEENFALPPGCIVIAVSGLDVPELSLQLSDHLEPRVVSTSGRQIKYPVAASLERLLYRTSFIDFRTTSQSNVVTYYANKMPEVWQHACAMAQEEGFRPEWFSDEWSFCGENTGTLIALNLLEGLRVWLRLASSDLETVVSTGRRFQQSLGLTQLLAQAV